MNEISAMPLAFGAGVVSFLSPCVLPLIPGYISLITGMALRDLTDSPDRAGMVKKAVSHSACFVMGFSAVFTALGGFASGLGSPLAPHLPLLKKISGILIILFGLRTMNIIPLAWIYFERSVPFSRVRPGPRGAFLMGAAFAFGWTPCVGPVLATMLTLAASETSAAGGMGLLFVYSMGIGIPFLLVAMGVGSFLHVFWKYQRLVRWGEITTGGLLVGVGVLMFTDRFTVLARLFSFLDRFVL
jgi:cytochrome c-type biogenesis protein